MLIKAEDLIMNIKTHGELVGTDNAAYSLAHNHIIDVVNREQDKTEKICEEIKGLCNYTQCVARCEDCVIYRAIDVVKGA